MKPYYDREGVTIYNGDTLAVLPELAGLNVDAVITDPPYSSGGVFRGDRAGRTTTEKYVNSDAAAPPADFAGDTRDQRGYLAWCSLWLAHALAAARPGAILGCFTDWRQLPTTTDAIQAGGWVWRGIVVWDKTEASRPRAWGYRAQGEFLPWGSKGPMREDLNPRYGPGVIRAGTRGGDKLHIAEKPESLMAGLLSIVPPGGTVLDPFLGSGSTLVTAKRMGLRVVGIEILEDWCRTAAQRCEQGILGLDLAPSKPEPAPATSGVDLFPV